MRTQSKSCAKHPRQNQFKSYANQHPRQTKPNQKGKKSKKNIEKERNPKNRKRKIQNIEKPEKKSKKGKSKKKKKKAEKKIKKAIVDTQFCPDYCVYFHFGPRILFVSFIDVFESF